MTTLPRCPICKKPAEKRPANPAFPFCSDRCRLVDLGRWLGEEYRVADSSADERDDEDPASAQPPAEDEN